VIADDRRQMDRNTFSEVVNAFGHVPRDVSPKHGPHTLECLRCNERGIHVNGQMQPSLLEEKCFGQPIPKEPESELLVDTRAPVTVSVDEGFTLDKEQVARLVAYAEEHNLPLGTLEGGTASPAYTLPDGPVDLDLPADGTLRNHLNDPDEPPEEKDGTPKTRSTRRTPASPDVPANLRV
jgi:hypothetical protein